MDRVETLEELGRVRAADSILAEGAHVHEADVAPHRPILFLLVTVVPRSMPWPGPRHVRAQGEMAMVQCGPQFEVMVVPGRGLLDGQRSGGGARGGHRGRPGDARFELPHAGAQMSLTHQPLTRSHGHRGVTLQDLGRCVTFAIRGFHFTDAHVLAKTDDPRLRGGRQVRLHLRYGHRDRLQRGRAAAAAGLVQ